MMPKTLEELYKRKIIVGVFNSTEKFYNRKNNYNKSILITKSIWMCVPKLWNCSIELPPQTVRSSEG